VEERHRDDPDTRIVDELGLCQGQVRVDVAVVNGVLQGYEIKSLVDTLRRLPNQVRVYSQVLDLATIVLAECHRADACSLIPDWWEVIVAFDDARGVRLEVFRSGSMNQDVDKRSLAELLWHAEAMQILRSKAEHRGLAGKPRSAAWDRLAQVCSTDEIRAAVRVCIKGRVTNRLERLQR
jgi:hypothetical protein